MLRAPGVGAMRIARGSVCAGMCLLLGCVAHAWNEGRLPDPGSLVLAFGALAVVCVGLANQQRDFLYIFVVLAGAQLFLHFGFAVAAARSASMSAGGHMVGHTAGDPHPGVHGTDDGFLGWPAGMAAGHVLATLASAGCMAYGERVAWWLARLVLPLLPVRRPQPVPAVPPPGPRNDTFVLLPARHGVLLARGLARRGPPLWSSA